MTTKEYRVELIEKTVRVLYVQAQTAAEAKQRVMGSPYQSGLITRTVKATVNR